MRNFVKNSLFLLIKLITKYIVKSFKSMKPLKICKTITNTLQKTNLLKIS